MTKRTFDTIIIVSIALFLIGLEFFDLTEKVSKFMFTPILAYYFIGQYSERRFRK